MVSLRKLMIASEQKEGLGKSKAGKLYNKTWGTALKMGFNRRDSKKAADNALRKYYGYTPVKRKKRKSTGFGFGFKF